MATRPDKPAVAKTSEQALEFVRELQRKFASPPRDDKEAADLRAHLEGFDPEDLKGVARRVIIDLMRGPRATDAPSRSPPQPKPPPSPKGGDGRAKDANGRNSGKGKAAPRAGGKRRPVGKS